MASISSTSVGITAGGHRPFGLALVNASLLCDPGKTARRAGRHDTGLSAADLGVRHPESRGIHLKAPRNGGQRPRPTTDAELRLLHEALLDYWNERNAEGFAGLFTDDGMVVGFDGSQMNGRQEIASQLGQIFADHQTAAYAGKVRTVKSLTADVAVLQAVVGMVPPGQSDVNSAVNAVQILVAVRPRGKWRIAVLQNTPAAYHGRPEMVQLLTDELREV